MGHAAFALGRCEGVQEVIANETGDEEGGSAEAVPEGERDPIEFCHGEGDGFCHGFATIGQILNRFWSPCAVVNFGSGLRLKKL
jgi:hypothetical protein